jgi:hypothetical protein
MMRPGQRLWKCRHLLMHAPTVCVNEIKECLSNRYKSSRWIHSTKNLITVNWIGSEYFILIR